MLQNATWLAIVAVHTDANELPKVRQVMNKIHRNIGGSSAEDGSGLAGGGGRGRSGVALAVAKSARPLQPVRRRHALILRLLAGRGVRIQFGN